MTSEGRPAWLKRSFVWVLLPLWVAFAASWAVISVRYGLHLDLLPLPQAGSISLNLVVVLLYVPPVLCLLAALRVFRREKSAGRALRIVGWAMAALLVVPTAFAAFNVIQIVTRS